MLLVVDSREFDACMDELNKVALILSAWHQDKSTAQDIRNVISRLNHNTVELNQAIKRGAESIRND